MKSLILLNGPPRCGKDTAGVILAARLESVATYSNGRRVEGIMLAKMSAILKERTHALYQILDEGGVPARFDALEDCKDLPHPDFFGKTPRQAYIAVSELLLKPLHGEDILGRILARRVAQCDQGQLTVIVTDSGFRAESEPLAAMAERTLLVHIHREGCTFEGDSRDYWNWRAPHGPERSVIELVNPGTMEGYERVLESVVEWARSK